MVYEALAKFDRIYDLQEAGRVFETPEELWSEWLLLDQALFRALYYTSMIGNHRLLSLIS